jgi:NAD(P)-dependent dehydrogenase (short-subunit alcohol dehydrogenase family)
MAEEGARVLVVDVDLEAAQRNVDGIRAAGGDAEAMHADVGTLEGVQAMVERAVSRFGKLTLLVNNAFGGYARGNAETVAEEGWDRGMDLGLKSMFRAAKLAVPHMRAAGGGAMVNISSVHGFLVAPNWMVYETLKAGVIGLSRQLAAEYGPDGIRVNAICPGHIVTERLEERWRADPEGLRFFEQQYPVRRTGKPVDIANAVVYLCSDEAAFVTGHALVVDGGLSIQLAEDLSVRLARYALAHPEALAGL